jgi:dienelactone hydrolase
MTVERRRVLAGLAGVPLSSWAAAAPPPAPAAAPAAKPLARIEAVPFATQTVSDADFLSGAAGQDVTIAGVLRLPRTDAGRLPTVVLLHGSGGPIAYVDAWAQRLHEIGWATFTVDSFSGRGLASVRDDQAALGRLAGVLDAYRALERLSTHPLLQPSRIVLMGFSRGGQGALYAAMQRFQRQYLHGEARFAAHIAFYPNCCTRYLQDEAVTAPIRIYQGEADDFNPIDATRAYVQRLQAAGRDVQLTAYPDAHHVFDWEGFATPLKAPKAQTMRHCRVVERTPGVLLEEGSGRPFTYADPCVEQGTTVAYQPQAAQAAIRSVTDWLQSGVV